MTARPLPDRGRPGALWAAALAAILGVGCGRTVTDYARHAAAAERAYSSGRYDEAAAAWSSAALAAKGPSQRDEARYREAASLSRAGRYERAGEELDALVHDSPGSARAPRAALDRAALLIEHGDEDAGYHALDATIRTYPNSGVAAAALNRYLAWLSPRGEEGVRSYLTTLASLDATELGPYVEYAVAESLERSEELPAARTRFAFVADRYPYPAALWDDSLWNAADLDLRLGEPKAAVERLERLLRARETSYFQGSYERPRYAEAEFKLAEIYRDKLADPVRSRALFERLWTDFPESRLRDDAKWNAAVMAAARGDEPSACRDLKALAAEIPTSRYVPCAPRLCPALAEPSGATCHDYLLRTDKE